MVKSSSSQHHLEPQNPQTSSVIGGFARRCSFSTLLRFSSRQRTVDALDPCLSGALLFCLIVLLEGVCVSPVAAQTAEAGLVLSPSPVQVDEGGSTSYTVKLAKRPSGQVTVEITNPSGSGRAGNEYFCPPHFNLDNTPCPDSWPHPPYSIRLEFTQRNWHLPQTVMVSIGEDDAEDTNWNMKLNHTASGGGYIGVSAEQEVWIRDNDAINQGTVTLSSLSQEVLEGEYVQFLMRFDPPPKQEISAPKLDFTWVGNFGSVITAQGISVSGGRSNSFLFDVRTDDNDIQDMDGSVTATIFPLSLNGYRVGSPGSVTVIIKDDDAPGESRPKISIYNQKTPIIEGADAMFTVSASPQPDPPITVNLFVEERGSFVLPGDLDARSIEIGGTSPVAFFSVRTVDDDVDEANGNLTVSILSGQDYKVNTERSMISNLRQDQALVSVEDNDDVSLNISGLPDKINNTNSLMATFTFSEAVTGFVLADDITVTGGTAGALSGSGASYSLPITPTGNADVVVTVLPKSVVDTKNNLGPFSAVTHKITWDAAVPTLAIGGVPLKINDRTAFTASFTFSEAVTGFVLGDVTVTGAAPSSFSGAGASYSVVLTPTGNVDVDIEVAANVATDGVNQAPAAPVTAKAEWDASVPTLAIGGVPGKINSTTAFTASFTFSEAVTGFVLADVGVTGGAASGFTGSGASYSATITPTGASDVVVSVGANSATDGVNLAPANEVLATAVWDAAVPTLAIGGVPLKINDRTAFTASFTFSEAVTGFVLGDVTVTGAAPSSFSGAGASYSVVLTPTGNVDVDIEVAANVATDGVNQAPAAPVTAKAEWDASVPTLAIGGVPGKINSTTAFTASFTFSEAVTGFVLADVGVTGGAASGFTGSGASYSATITPTGASDVVVSVGANSATDGVNLAPANEVLATAVWDAAVPTLAIGGVPLKINDRTAFTASFTFSEAVTGFVLGDVTVTGAAPSSFSGAGASYSVVLTPTGNVDVDIEVAANVATDGVNQAPAAPVTAKAEWDASVPTLAIGGVPGKINSTTAFTASFTFSEAVTGFVLADVGVTGGAASGFTGSGASYSATITPTGASDVVVSVGANSATDGVNLAPANEVLATAVWDAAVPTLAIGGVPLKINDRTAFTASFTFSEAVTGFVLGDVTVTGAAPSSFSGAGASYSVVLTPTGNVDVDIEVAANVATDGVNQAPAAPVTAKAEWDASVPTLAIGGVPGKINSTTAFTASFTFSEAVTGFVLADVGVTGGAASGFTGSGASYSATITPTGASDVVVSVGANSATDGVNLAPANEVLATAVWDAAVPTLAIGGVPLKINDRTAFTASFTFSEAVTGFVLGDVTVTGAAPSSFSGAGASYSVVLTPTGNVDVDIEVAANVATDGVNQAPAAPVTAKAEWDASVPTLAIGGVPGKINSTTAFTASFTFSEAVTGFVLADVGVTGGAASGFTGSGASYSATITPTGASDVVVSVGANSATDGVNLAPANEVLATAVWDAAVPTLAIGGVPLKINDRTAFTASFTFSEAVTGFVLGDVTVTGAAPSSFSGAGASYSVVLTPTGNVDVDIEVAANVATDGVNQAPAAPVTAKAEWDASVPTLAIGGVPGKINSTTAFTASFTFSEAVTGFVLADVGVTGGAASGFTGSGASYSATITPTGASDVVVSVGANSATDGVNLAPANEVLATAVWDAAVPTLAIGGVPLKINDRTAFTASFTFSEAVTGFVLGDVTVTGAAPSSFSGAGASYSVVLTPTGNVDVDIEVAANVATDGVNQAPAAPVTAKAEWDASVPTLAIGGVPGKINSTTAFTASFTFSEAVTGFVLADVGVTGGAASGFTGSGASYSATITPTGASDVVVSVGANSATDGVNLAPANEVLATAVWDAAVPTLAIGGVPLKINDRTAFTASFTFSEAVTGFVLGDVTVTGAAPSSFSGAGASYSVVLTPTGNVDVDIEVAANVATDGVNQAPAAPVTAKAEWDASVPTLAIGGVPGKINSTTAFTASFTFSEAVTGFVLADVGVTGGAASGFTGSGASYSATITPTGASDVVVSVGANSATDGVNLAPANEVLATAVWDAAVPTLAIGGVPLKINDRTAFTASFTFSEAVTGFVLGDVTVTGAAPSSFSGAGASYSVVLTPTGNVDVDIEVAANVATDGVNQAPAAPVTAKAEWDASVPTLAIGGVPGKINSTTAFTASFTFSEAVTGFVLADVGVTGGAASGFTGSGASYSATITPTGASDVVVSVGANSATDGVNLAPANEVLATAVWDAAVPTLAIGGVPLKINDRTAFTASFTFSEAVTGFVLGDVTVTGAAPSSFSGAGASYSVVLTPTGNVDVDIEVAANVATDGVNQAPAAPVTAKAEWDASVPTLAIGGVPGKINSTTAFTASFTFSEAVTGFVLADVGVTGGAASGFTGSGASYSATITPTGASDVVVSVGANSATDGVNLAPANEVLATAVWDAAVPTLAIGGVPLKINDRTAFTASFTFSEAVTGFVLGDVTVTGAAPSSFSGAGASYSVVLTPTGNVDVDIEVAANVATDGVNQAPAAPVTAKAEWDASVPTLAIGGVPGKINSTTAFTASFTFSEAVTGFVLADVGVTGGAASGFTGSGASYSATITPTGASDVVVSVGANSATDGVNLAPANEVLATAVWDAAVPTLAIGGVPLKINDRTAFTASFTFSEAVTGFVLGDVTVTGAAPSSFSGAGASYSVVLTPTGNVDVDIEVAANVATDGVNQAPAAPVTAKAEWDASVPTLAIGGVPGKINSTTAFTASFTFSEAVTGFVLADVGVTGGAASGFTGSGASYSATITPTGASDVVVSVGANSATDGVNLAPANEVLATAVWDAAVPTLAIGGVPLKINDRTAFTASFTFSEAVTGFVLGDVTVTGAAPSSFSGAGASYSVVLTPTGNVDVDIEVAANVATDGVNQAPAAPVTAKAEWDASVPTLAIGGVPGKINSTTAFTASFTFSEAVTGFVLADVGVTGGAASGFTGSGASYSATITPTGASDVVVSVGANSATDGVNLAPAAEVSATATWDAAAPTVTISDLPDKINNTAALTATFTFSESVTGFAASDVTLTSGSKGAFSGSDGDTEYTLVINPASGSDLTVTVLANGATDGVNLGPSSAVTHDITWDAAVPTLAIGGVPEKINSTTAFTASFTFSEAVTGFVLADDITVTGGTAGALSGSGASYSLPITPSGGSDVVVTVDANSVTDGVNLAPAAEVSATATWDAAAPTVTISDLPDKINNTAALTATFTFSESVTGFAASDVTLTSGSKGAFSGSDGDTEYTLVINPASGSDLTVTVLANGATDGVNLGPSSAVTHDITWDAAVPTLAIGGVPEKINSTTAFTASFTFSEAVTGFVLADDITVTGGTAGALSGSGASYSLPITPSGGSDVVVTVDANSVTDGVNLAPENEVLETAVWDAAAPTVTISDLPDKINSTAALTATFTFSESVTGFAASDVTLTSGSKGAFSGSDGDTEYTLVINPASGSDLTVTVLANGATDGVNLGPSSAVTHDITWDAAVPTLAIGGVPEKINSTTAFTASFTFSESVTGLVLADDVTVTGGTAGALSGSGASYSLPITPSGGSDVVVTVGANSVTDGVNLAPAAEVSATATWDAAAPTVTISDLPDKINSTAALTATFTFSESVTGFAASDVTLTSGSKGAFSGSDGDTEYTLVINPASGSDLTVTVLANGATDGVNLAPAAEVSATATWDAAAPTVTISDLPDKINSTAALTATFTFSESVTGFAASDVTLTSGSKGAFSGSDGDTEYTLVINPASGSDLTVTVLANGATDGVNLGPSSAVTHDITWDAAVPTLAIGGVPGKINSTTAFTASFTFSEAVTGFVLADDVTVTGAAASSFSGAGASYSVVLTPTGGTDVVVTVSANSVTDDLGNSGPATAVTATATWDASAPTVDIAMPTRINSAAAFTASFTFDKAVTGFVLADDVTVTGAAASSFSGAGASYSVVLTPSGGSDVVVTVSANSVTDDLGNSGPATAVTATATWDASAPTVDIAMPTRINSAAAFTATFTFDKAVTGFVLADDVTVSGGAAGALTGSGASYSLPITPSGGTDVVVTVAANSVTDQVGNFGPATAVTATATWDASAPTVDIAMPTRINSAAAFTASFTFDKAVTGFVLADDVTVSGGAAGALTGSGASYSLPITPSGGSDVVVTVSANSVTDDLGNSGPAAAASATATWDASAPTVDIAMPTRINSAAAFTATFTFDKAVTGFVLADDVTVSGGTAGALTGSGSSYSLPITPSGGSDVVVTVSANSVTDNLGNSGPATAAAATAIWDASAPTVTISMPTRINSAAAFTASFTFDKAVTGFVLADDVTVSGGTAGALTGSGSSYSLPITPTGGSNVVVTVAANSVTDDLGNSGPATAAAATATWDASAPTVTISMPNRINSAAPLTATFTFDKAVTGFVLADDVTVTGGAAGALTGSGSSYRLPITPSGGSDVVVTVGANSVTDNLGNSGPATAVTETAIWDAAAPTLLITGVPSKINDRTPLTATFTFSESVTGFEAADVSVTGAAPSSFTGSGASYSVVLTPAGASDVVVTVGAQVASDGVNLAPASPVTARAEWDALVPTLLITGVPSKINNTDAFTATLTFSENVTGFVAADVSVSGGAKGALTGSGASYRLPITPVGGADVVVTVGARVVSDGVNLAPASPVTARAEWDFAPPTIEISVPAKINSTDVLTAIFTFDKTVTGFAAADVRVTGGTAGALSGSGSSYTMPITPAGGEDVVVTVAANSVADNLGTAGPETDISATAVWDALVPTLLITGVPGKINTTDAFTATFTFSEEVTGFEAADVSVTGGTKGALTGRSDTYTMALTPDGSADVVVTVGAEVASDGVNLAPAEAVEVRAVWDADVPTVRISGLPNKINTTDALTATFTFSESVTGFAASDVTLTSGSKGAFSGSDGDTEYTLGITPASGSDLEVTVVAGGATDGLNRAPVTAVTHVVSWDASVATLVLTGVPGRINTTDAFTASFTFSENVMGFVAADVGVTGAVAGALTGSGDTYAMPITPTGSADVVVSVGAEVATDGANLAPAAEVTATAVWDVDVPTLAITGVPEKINRTDALTATFTFSEEVTGFEATDVRVTGGTKGALTGSRTSYTMAITPDGSADVVVSVGAEVATDGVNLAPAADVSATAVWDADVPTLAITGVPGKINTTDAFTATFVFSEEVTGFEGADVSVTGGTKGALTGSGTSYTMTLTPAGASDVVVTVGAQVASDGVNLAPAEAVSATATWDATVPTLLITGVPVRINRTDAFTATFTFDRVVTGFEAADVTVSGGIKGALTGSGTSYTMELTPAGEEDVVVTVGAHTVIDNIGNTGPSAAVSATAKWDVVPPTVAISVPAWINNTTPLTATFTFDKPVTGFEAADITVTGGAAGALTGSGASYTMVLTPAGEEDVVVTVSANSVTDTIGNIGPSAAVSATATWDVSPPTVEISVPTRINSTIPFTASFAFDRAVTGFEAADVSVSGGTKGALGGSRSSYTMPITPSGDADVVVSVGANTVTDNRGRTGPSTAATATATWDTSPPTVEISVPPRIRSTAPLTASFTFDQAVTGFAASDVTVTGAAKGSLSGSSDTYTMALTPAGGTDVVVTVNANSVTDNIGTPGPPVAVSATAVWQAITVDPKEVTLAEGTTLTDAFAVSLSAAPTSEVTITLSDNGNSNLNWSADTLTFTPTNFGTPQRVSLTAAEDDRDYVDEEETLILAASGAEYDGDRASLQVTITDNDTDLVVADQAVTVPEGGTATFEIELSHQPSDEVSVIISGYEDSDLEAVPPDPLTLTFTPANYDDAQTVTLHASEDEDIIHDQVVLTLTAKGAQYEDKTSTVQVTIEDKDRGTINAAATISVSEGAEGAFEVSLSDAPSANVTVELSGHVGTGLEAVPPDPLTLTFTPQNYGDVQTVTLTAGSDLDIRDETAVLTLRASGAEYDGRTAEVTVTIEDTDQGTITAAATISMNEGAEGTFEVSLSDAPSEEVTIEVSGHAGTDLAGTPPDPLTLTFTPANYGDAQTVTLTAGSDSDILDDEVVLTLTASGAEYDGMTAEVTVTIRDEDQGVIVAPGTLTIKEAASTSFAVSLSDAPSEEVTIEVSGHVGTDLEAVPPEPLTLTFMPANYGIAQTVTLHAAEDEDILDETAVLTLRASGAEYDGMTSQITVTITDDDQGLILAPGALTMDEGVSARFAVSLSDAPSQR